jgi:hypothetical protein
LSVAHATIILFNPKLLVVLSAAPRYLACKTLTTIEFSLHPLVEVFWVFVVVAVAVI